MKRLIVLCSVLMICSVAPGQTTSARIKFPTLGNHADEQATLLSIDDYSLPLKQNLCYFLSKPQVRTEPVLLPERDNPQAPDQTAAHFYGTVLHDAGKFRMWYYAVSNHRPGDLKLGPVCYAESADGIAWRKPILGQLEHRGSKQNNAISLPDSSTQGANVIKEEQEPDPQRRYKMVYTVLGKQMFTTRTATSPDGFTWTAGPLTHPDQFLEQASFYKHNGNYFINAHTYAWGNGGRLRGRQGYVWISPDFDRWIQEPAGALVLPEPAKSGWEERYDQVHLGVGAASFGNIVVGLYGLWHERGWGVGGTSCDFGLVVSHNGIHFREPVKSHVYLSSEEAAIAPVAGKNYPTILCQSSGILNVGDETRIYFGRWRNSEWPLEGDGSNYYGDIALATLPRDRWGALGLAGGNNSGSVWSAPITLPQEACEVTLNADAASAMRVEVADERFALLPEFSGDRSGVCTQPSGLKCPVQWPGAKFGQLAGRTIRLRVHLTKTTPEQPRLYAIYVTCIPKS